METHPTTLAGLVTREVRNGSRGGQPTKIAVARRTYPTGRADLWDALTNPERIPRWFLPVTGELKEGGRYQLEGNAGGVVEECDEPERFAITWELGPMVSWLEVTLHPADPGTTTLQVVHEAHVDPGLWAQFGPGAVGIGWDLALLALRQHLEGAAPDPGYPLSSEGATFVEGAAGAWADAAVAAGDEPGAARRAADQTVAMYTTAPDEG